MALSFCAFLCARNLPEFSYDCVISYLIYLIFVCIVERGCVEVRGQPEVSFVTYLVDTGSLVPS